MRSFLIGSAILALLLSIIPTSLSTATKQAYQLYPNYISQENFLRYVQSKNKKLPTPFAKTLVEYIFVYSDFYNIHPLTILSVMKVESNFNPKAKGTSGEIGLMQISPRSWIKAKHKWNLIIIGKIKDKVELWGIPKNISAGVYILNVKRYNCNHWLRKGTLKKRGFRNIHHCTIRRYNGHGNREYYTKVTSALGDYYYFTQSTGSFLQKGI